MDNSRNLWTIRRLMEIVYKKNLKGEKCALCIDSVKEYTFFFIAFLNGAGVIPLSIKNKTNEFANAVYYLGLLEQQCVDINVVAIIKDRCMKMELDSKRFKMNNKTELTIINKTVNIYNDPYHLYKNFCKLIIKGDTDISKKNIANFFLQIRMTIKQWTQELI
jgi:hypothetical protein